MLGRLSYIIDVQTGQFKRKMEDVKKDTIKADRSMSDMSKNVEKNSRQMGQSLGGMPGLLKKIAAGFLAAFAARNVINGIQNKIKAVTQLADRMLDLKDITGISTDALQEYAYVSRIAGVSTEAVANAAQNLTNRFQNLHREQSPIARGFRDLGVNAFGAGGQLRNTGDIMEELITKMSSLDNATERNALGAQIFGGSWKDMAPILAMGTEGIKEAREEAHRLGIVMDKEAIKKANELRQEMERLKASSEALGNTLALNLIPAIASIAEKATAAIAKIKELSQTPFGEEALNYLNILEDVRTEVGKIADEEQRRMFVSDMIDELTAKHDGYFKRYQELSKIRFPNDVQKELIELYQNQYVQLGEAVSQLRRYGDEFVGVYDDNIKKVKEQQEQERKAEQLRRMGLGDIGRLNEDIAAAQKAFTEANSELERTAAQMRLNSLTKELELMQNIALTRALMADMGYTIPDMPAKITPVMDGSLPTPDKPELGEWKSPIDTEMIDVINQYHDAMNKAMVMNTVFGESFDLIQTQYDATKQAITRLIELGYDEQDMAIQRLMGSLTEMEGKMQDGQQSMMDWQQVAMGASAAIGMSFMQLAGDANKSVGSIIKDLLKQVTAMIITQIMSLPLPGSPFVNMALAAGAGGMAGALFNQIPGLAQGGVAEGETLAFVGDYPGAAVNPEVIAPLNKLKALLEPMITELSGGDEAVTQNIYQQIVEAKPMGVPQMQQIITQQLREANITPPEDLTQRIAQQIISAKVEDPVNLNQVILQELSKVDIPQVKDITQVIAQRLVEAQIAPPPNLEQTITQELIKADIPDIKDLSQAIVQEIVQSQAQQPEDIKQVITQSLDAVDIPNIADVAQTITQKMIDADIQDPKALQQTITQTLTGANIPTPEDLSQAIIQNIVQAQAQEPSDIQQVITQTLDGVAIPNVGDVVQKITQQVAGADIPQPEALTQTITQELRGVDTPDTIRQKLETAYTQPSPVVPGEVFPATEEPPLPVYNDMRDLMARMPAGLADINIPSAPEPKTIDVDKVHKDRKGNLDVYVEGRLAGDDILITGERAEKRRRLVE